MNESRDFSLGAILSVTDGHLLCPMGDVYEIVNYLTGDSITTIGLLAVHEPCKAALLEQHPHLADVDGGEAVNGVNWREFLTAQEHRFGPSLPVSPMKQWEPRTVADDILDVMRINPNADITVLEP